MSYTYAQIRTKLDTRLRDTANSTFTSAEKDEMVNEAFNDPHVFQIVADSSLTTVANQSAYTIPTGITSILQLLIDQQGDGYRQMIDPDAYDEINGQLIFNREYKYLPGNKTLYITGYKKLTTSDSIPDMQADYVLHLSMIAAMEMLMASYTTRFLTNDAKMSDLIASAQFHQREAARLRSAIDLQHVQVL